MNFPPHLAISSFGDCVFKNQVGSGGNGCVCLYKNNEGKECAVKFLAKEGTSGLAEARFDQEISVNKANNPQHFLQFFDSGKTNEVRWFAMEKAKPISKHGTEIRDLSFDKKLAFFQDIGQCLKCLQDRSVLHRDIKFSNIVQRENGTYTLCDFGLCYENRTMSQKTPHGDDPFCKSVFSLPPEAKLGSDADPHNLSFDIYYFACLIWSAFSRESDESENCYFELPGVNVEPLNQILLRSLGIPSRRPSIDQILLLLGEQQKNWSCLSLPSPVEERWRLLEMLRRKDIVVSEEDLLVTSLKTAFEIGRVLLNFGFNCLRKADGTVITLQGLDCVDERLCFVPKSLFGDSSGPVIEGYLSFLACTNGFSCFTFLMRNEPCSSTFTSYSLSKSR
jgi:serine/threonine protein kinase